MEGKQEGIPLHHVEHLPLPPVLIPPHIYLHQPDIFPKPPHVSLDPGEGAVAQQDPLIMRTNQSQSLLCRAGQVPCAARRAFSSSSVRD